MKSCDCQGERIRVGDRVLVATKAGKLTSVPFDATVINLASANRAAMLDAGPDLPLITMGPDQATNHRTDFAVSEVRRQEERQVNRVYLLGGNQ
jgi:hypothetical protein